VILPDAWVKSISIIEEYAQKQNSQTNLKGADIGGFGPYIPEEYMVALD
jgi:hypothetical protein